MKRRGEPWTVDLLIGLYDSISFPRFQREPTVWRRAAKQRLVDSMLRGFDIAPLYFDAGLEGAWECVDGRQRIAAIMSFLGKNPRDEEDNGFPLRMRNEIFKDEDPPFEALNDLTYKQLKEKEDGDEEAKRLIATFHDYELSVVELTDTDDPKEFNLQFARLNLGTIINSGEKLNAMTGDLRDQCFEKGNLGDHGFLELVKIPARRFAKQQVAAQIVAQVFSSRQNDPTKQDDEFTRIRHTDLGALFLKHEKLGDTEKEWLSELGSTLNVLGEAFEPHEGVLRNRAITVSTVLLAHKRRLADDLAPDALANFMEEFLCRLAWQVRLGIERHKAYNYLIDFQRHVTQASVEKPAVAGRAEVLEGGFEWWQEHDEILGDEEYLDETGEAPSAACRKKGEE